MNNNYHRGYKLTVILQELKMSCNWSSEYYLGYILIIISRRRRRKNTVSTIELQKNYVVIISKLYIVNNKKNISC